MEQLTPEERHRIYLEEKARMEVRQELKELQPKKLSIGSIIGTTVVVIIGLVAVLFVIGSQMEETETKRFEALSPAEKRAEAIKACTSLERSWAFKTYAELSPEERRVKYSCDHPSAE